MRKITTEIHQSVLHEEIQARAERATKALGRVPGLGVILGAGADKASEMYARSKENHGADLGIYVEVRTRIDPLHMVSRINNFNSSSRIDGLMVSLPIPEASPQETSRILRHIRPDKDVDRLHPDSTLSPATSEAILYIVDNDKRVRDYAYPDRCRYTVVGSEGVVGQGVVRELQKRPGTTVSTIDKRLENDHTLPEVLEETDILIAVANAAGFIENVPEGIVVIDAGVARMQNNGEWINCGNLHPNVYNSSSDFAATPFSNGVGKVTGLILMRNLLDATEAINGLTELSAQAA